MPIIQYTALDFPLTMDSKFHNTHEIDVTWAEVVWAAISVGKRSLGDMLIHNIHSIDEIIYRAYIVWANLWENEQHFYRSSAYENLDATEKGAISYFIGMTFSKLFALLLFDAPWMVHLDRLVSCASIGLTGRSRPDLVGVDSVGRWIIMEGKGRSGRFSESALQKAKLQVTQVKKIDGLQPYLRIGSQTYFEPSLTIKLIDPDEAQRDSVMINVGRKKIQQEYYRRAEMLRKTKNRTLSLGKELYYFFDFNLIGVSVGITKNAEESLPQEQKDRFIRDNALFKQKVFESEGHQYQAFPDGLAIGLDYRWAMGEMEKEPFNRQQPSDNKNQI